MMFHVLIFAVSTCVVLADFTCPDGILNCEEGKACCFQSGSGYSCCDKPIDTNNLINGTPSVRQPYDNQTLAAFSENILDYCPFTSGRKICCFPPYAEENCLPWSECCSGGDTCCPGGRRCCGNGQWCCLKKYKCGSIFLTCINGAMARGGQWMAVIVTAALAVMTIAKM